MTSDVCVRFVDLRGSFNKQVQDFELSDVPDEEIAKWEHGDGIIVKLSYNSIIDFCYWDNQITNLKVYWN